MTISFVKERKDRWQKLHSLVKKAEKSKLGSFTPQELIEFSVLYRQVTTDLAVAETQNVPDDVRVFLNDLTGRAYHHIYRNKKISWDRWKYFPIYTFPRLVRENRYVILFSLGILLVSMITGFFLLLRRPEMVYSLFPEGYLQSFIEKYREDAWFTSPWSFRPFVSSFLITNNLQVLITAFAGGMLLGTLTGYVLLLNGFLLGALSAEFFRAGLFLPFWAMILPHGVIELTAVALGGGAGFILARSLLFPGDYRRRDALRLHAGTAVQLTGGAILMIVVAGLIEGFFSTISVQVVPEWGRLLFAGITLLLVGKYFQRRPGQRPD